jgi:hypothetical protein
LGIWPVADVIPAPEAKTVVRETVGIKSAGFAVAFSDAGHFVIRIERGGGNEFS